MMFRPELAAAVMAGEKTVTRRACTDNPRSPWWRCCCSLSVGQSVAIQPGRGKHAIGRATVVSVKRQRLGHLTPAEARAEGFATPEAFEETFTAINGAYDPNLEVWRIGLAVDETRESTDDR
ncbi:MAG: ASCH domain-containing protein [Solirubrobacteraceae bacterium]